MTKKIRLILFFLFVVLFFLIAPQIILYSLGYRFDFEKKKFIGTGGIYLKIWPPDAEVSVDERIKKKTSFLTNQVLISNLLPKYHKILVEKQGYYPWSKTLEIKQGEVVKAENIVLIKENPVFEPLKNNVDNFYFSADAKNIALAKILNNRVSLEIFEVTTASSKNVFSFPVSVKKISEVIWLFDSKIILVKANTDKGIEYFILETDKTAPGPVTAAEYLDKNAYNISFNPQNSQELFFVKNNILYLKNTQIQPIIENLLVYEFSKNNIIWLSIDGFLYKSDFSGKIIEKLTKEAFVVKGRGSYKLIILPQIIFLKENENLFLLNQGSGVFEKFYSPVKDLKISPNSTKIVYFNDNEILFSYLISSNPEKIFLNRFSEKIGDCLWLNNDYLVFTLADLIKISETDVRDGINIVNLPTQISYDNENAVEIKNPKIFLNQYNKKLYILTKNNLFVSEKIIP